jgi:serine/arginine repetitive matrix protein 1
MPGGGLRILPQKSWNVWRQDCIEKVKRDERKHEDEEDEKRIKQLAVDHEARVLVLKQRAKGKQPAEKQPQLEDGSKTEERDSACSQGHINFFADIERDLQKMEGNADHEKEKKAQEAKEARKLGIAPWGLGQAKETDESKPWYKFPSGEAPTKYASNWGRALYGQAAQKRAGRENVRKDRADPMQEVVHKYPQITNASSTLSSTSSSSTSCSTLVVESKSERSRRGNDAKKKRKHKEKKHKRHKKHKRKKRKKHESSSSSSESSSSASDSEAESELDVMALVTRGKVRTVGSISRAMVAVEPRSSVDELRVLRLERERHERAKVAMMLMDKGQTGVPKQVQENDRKRGYNQQFNPQRARQNRDHQGRR